MTGKDVLPDKDLLDKAAALKRYKYSKLGTELKKQTSVAEKQYRDFDNVFNYDEKEEPLQIEKEEQLTINKLSLCYKNKYAFNEFKDVEKYAKKNFKQQYKITFSFRFLSD